MTMDYMNTFSIVKNNTPMAFILKVNCLWSGIDEMKCMVLNEWSEVFKEHENLQRN